MKLDVPTLARLSPLMDEALELDGEQLAAWLSSISADDTDLIPTLRELLSKKASVQTLDILQRGPEFTAAGVATDLSDFKVGDAIGPYRLIREIGVGGMGVVWLAERSDGGLKRTVALKLPMVTLRRSVLLQRFERERDILASLAHPNIARLYDAGISDEGQPYLALEYVQGGAITHYAQDKKLDCRMRVRVLLQVMDAIQFAHANLVIHRDLKPSNILVTAQGQALLLDFGIAKLLEGDASHADETELTHMGGRALTLAYAAPEQVEGEAISIATDVWALGVLLYELTTGIRPFESKSGGLSQAILHTDPVWPSRTGTGAIVALSRGLALDLDTIVLKALKKNAAERYASVSSFAEDLRRWLCGEPVMAQKDSRWYRARKFVGRHHWAVAAASLSLVALTGFTLSLDAQVHKVTRERNRADSLAEFMTKTFKVADPSEERSGRVTARELLDNAARNLDSGLTTDPDLRAGLARTMGRAYSGLGALPQSEDLLRKEYERARIALGDDAPSALALGSELVSVLSIRWQSAEAETLARDVLARQRTVLGADSPQTAVTETNLAYVLSLKGQFDEAIALDRHSLEIARRQAPADDPDLLEREATIGYYMLKSGKADPRETEQIFRKLVAVYRAKHGAANPKTLQAINGLAAVLARERRFDEEESLLRQALADGRKELGSEHPRMMDLLNNLAACLINKGDLDHAEPVLNESIAINLRVEGPGSPRAAMAKYNLACVKARRGYPDAALALLADAVHHGLIPDAALEMESEEDLVSLRGDPRFESLVRWAKEHHGKPLQARG